MHFLIILLLHFFDMRFAVVVHKDVSILMKRNSFAFWQNHKSMWFRKFLQESHDVKYFN